MNVSLKVRKKVGGQGWGPLRRLVVQRVRVKNKSDPLNTICGSIYTGDVYSRRKVRRSRVCTTQGEGYEGFLRDWALSTALVVNGKPSSSPTGY